jgi:hypothetical protein
LREIVNICLFQLSDLYRWFRYKEAAGIEAQTLIKSVLDNPNQSKPLGCRNYLKGENGTFVVIPDSLKVNDVNLYLSILFYNSSFIHYPEIGVVKVQSFGMNNTCIMISSNMSYWHQYATHVVYILNQGKLTDTLSTQTSQNKRTSNGKSNLNSSNSSRNYSS